MENKLWLDQDIIVGTPALLYVVDVAQSAKVNRLQSLFKGFIIKYILLAVNCWNNNSI